jgi:hypothetical protein
VGWGDDPPGVLGGLGYTGIIAHKKAQNGHLKGKLMMN